MFSNQILPKKNFELRSARKLLNFFFKHVFQYIARLIRPLTSVADPVCLSRLPDPNFSNPDPGAKRFPSPDRGTLKTVLSSRKNDLGCSKLSENDLECSSRIRIFLSRIPGSKKHRILGSATMPLAYPIFYLSLLLLQSTITHLVAHHLFSSRPAPSLIHFARSRPSPTTIVDPHNCCLSPLPPY
jgi:hypothetical protein